MSFSFDCCDLAVVVPKDSPTKKMSLKSRIVAA